MNLPEHGVHTRATPHVIVDDIASALSRWIAECVIYYTLATFSPIRSTHTCHVIVDDIAIGAVQMDRRVCIIYYTLATFSAIRVLEGLDRFDFYAMTICEFLLNNRLDRMIT